MSDAPLNSQTADPWAPVRREPIAKKKPETEAAPEKQKPSVLAELLVGVPRETIKAITDLAAAQLELAGKMEAVAAGNKEAAEAMQAIGKQHAELTAQLTRQTHALVSIGERIEGFAKAVERAAAAPRKVSLKRDAAGVAVEAVSRPMKEGTAA